MDAITFRQNDMLIKEIERIRENEAGQYKVKIAIGIQKTIQAITPPTLEEWRNHIRYQLKNNI